MTSKVSIPNLQKTLIYLAAFCIILNVGCVYTHISGGGHLDGVITFLPGVLLFCVVLLRRTFIGYRVNGAFLISIALAIYLLLISFAGGANLRNTLAEIALITLFLIYYSLIEKDEKPYLLIAYRDIVFIIATISLVFWLLGSMLHVISPSSTVLSNWGVSGGGRYNELKSYYHLYFELDRTYIFGRFITSNRSIFVERAFASFAFSIGWLYELFIERNKSKLRLVILSVTMITTLSMTGLIVVALTFMLYYIFNGTNHRLLNFIRIIFIPVMLGLTWFSINYLLDVKFSMGHSASSRISDFVNGFEAWKQKPIFGYGFGNSGEIHQLFRTGYSNSITMILTQGGLAMALLYIFAFVKGIHDGVKKHNINSALFVSVVLIMMAFTAIAFTDIIIYLLLVFGFGGLSTYEHREEVQGA